MMCEYAMISCDLRGRENITIPWCSCHLVISLVAACSAGIYAKVCSFHSVLSWLVEGLRILFGLFSWLDIVKLPLATGTWGNCYFLCISLASFFASTPGLMICMNQGNSGRLINKNSHYFEWPSIFWCTLIQRWLTVACHTGREDMKTFQGSVILSIIRTHCSTLFLFLSALAIIFSTTCLPLWHQLIHEM